MNEQTTESKTSRFTLRTDQDTELIVRHTYELLRQKCLLEGIKVPSLNDFLLEMVNLGIQADASQRTS